MRLLKKYSLGTAVIAMIAMPITPVSAADLNVASPSNILVYDDGQAGWAEDNSDGRRRHRRHRRHKVRGSDILVGAAILGTIAVIAGSSNREKQNRRSRNNYPAPQRAPQQSQQGSFTGNDIGSAVNACSNAALQSAGNEYRVNQIRSVTRDGEGWRVDGDLLGPQNASFACGVSNGRIQFIQLN